MSEDSQSYLRHEFELEFVDELRFSDADIANATVGTTEFVQTENLARAKVEVCAFKELGLKKGELCAVSGSARWSETIILTPEDDEGSDSDTIERNSPGQTIMYKKFNEDVVGVQGIYLGFYARQLSGEDTPRLWCAFELDSFSYTADELCQDVRTHVMYVDPYTAQIVPADRFEEPYADEEVEPMPAGEPMLDELFSRSHLFSQLIQSTGFRRMSHKKQIREVDNLIAEAEAVTDIREAGVALIAQYGYVVPTDAEGNPDYSADFRFVGLNDMVLSGMCLALSSSSWSSLRTKAIRNDGDVLNKYDGLCVAVELGSASDLVEHSPVKVGDIVHVPLSGQDVGFMIH